MKVHLNVDQHHTVGQTNMDQAWHRKIFVLFIYTRNKEMQCHTYLQCNYKTYKLMFVNLVHFKQ